MITPAAFLGKKVKDYLSKIDENFSDHRSLIENFAKFDSLYVKDCPHVNFTSTLNCWVTTITLKSQHRFMHHCKKYDDVT